MESLTRFQASHPAIVFDCGGVPLDWDPRYLYRKLFDWFEAIVISGEVGLVTPDPRSFRMLLSRVGRAPEECLFIDDAEANVAAPRRLGFDVIRFASPEQLERELIRRALLKSGDGSGPG